MRRVLIANRGEIALRAIRTCRRLGLDSVAVYSSADGNSPHRWAADHACASGRRRPRQAISMGGADRSGVRAANATRFIPATVFWRRMRASLRCTKEGLNFIGSSAEVIAWMGDKVAARQTAASLGIPVVPGSSEGFTIASEAKQHADAIGYPLLLKASAGGGGRGMRVVNSANAFNELFAQACAEAAAAFGRPDVYLERFFPKVRHIEIQVFGDRHGNYVQLGERDCSVQRRHQKLIEEAPSPMLEPSVRKAMADAALTLVRALNYVERRNHRIHLRQRECALLLH